MWRLKFTNNLKNRKEILPYLGYGKENTIKIMGSAFYERRLNDSRINDSNWTNAKRMIRLFHQRPVAHEEVLISFNGHSKKVITDDRGYFETELNFDTAIGVGYHHVQYSLLGQLPNPVTAHGKCLVVDSNSTLGIISDIDDTIVTSHAYGFSKKIRTALFNNAHTRETNTGIVSFYKELHTHGGPFFYVSSSERNMYGYWMNFLKTNGFPIGPLLLKELKYGIKDLILTGKGKHNHKYEKITHILNFYPFLSFILVGDNGQEDVEIYHSVVLDFPHRIKGIIIVPTLQKSLDRDIVADCKKYNVDILTIDDGKESLNTALKELCL
ncbi:MAG: hypothetical protein CMH46_16320 [Muricauda sp.]|nr:phosphatase domain-containing protein [Allomuricauda sp.]MAU17094.1 hypothetical protein [Allomuricauda sp.]|tara:strand:+ start:14888 stop:15865 length:978 start_codon:yes stop_codon:yes gene_type:complete